jgi:hypothetical protein
MIKLELKHSKSKWVKIGVNNNNEPIEFELDYPTIQQEAKLQQLLLRDSEKQDSNYKILEYQRYLIKCSVKNWKGIIDSEGNNIDCKLINNELEDELWWALVKDIQQTIDIGSKINSEIEFTNSDKKK